MNNLERQNNERLDLKRPSSDVFPELDEILSRSWNLTPKDEVETGERSYQNGICGVSVAHSEKEGVLLVAVTSSAEMRFSRAAAVSAVKQMQDALVPNCGSCDVMSNWVKAGRGAVLVFGRCPSDNEANVRKIEELRPRVVSILPYRDFA